MKPGTYSHRPGLAAIVSGMALNSYLGAAVMGLMLVAPGGNALAQAAWPSIALPGDARPFDIGEQVTVNGLAMRMQGFVSARKPAQLAEWFRQRLGQPLVENMLAKQLILGRTQGEYYLTVQLESAGAGTRGVAAVTHLKAAYDNRAENQVNAERWLSRLPAGSRLMSRMTSEDAGKVSTYLLVTNTQNENLNRDRLKNLMRDDGYVLEQEAVLEDKGSARQAAWHANGRTLFFKGSGKEAMATIYRDSNGNTAMTLNTITQVERFK